MNTYNGWKNRQTWNVALWIGNDQGLYSIARECKSYGQFKDEMLAMGNTETPDGVSYTDRKLSIRELNACIRELSA